VERGKGVKVITALPLHLYTFPILTLPPYTFPLHLPNPYPFTTSPLHPPNPYTFTRFVTPYLKHE